MKLSEAILKGAALIPEQPRGGAYFTWVDGQATCACAIGAAVVGYLGYVPSEEEYYGGDYEIGIEEETVIGNLENALLEVVHPISQKPDDAMHIAIGLYEKDQWSREAIAAYLESVGA